MYKSTIQYFLSHTSLDSFQINNTQVSAKSWIHKKVEFTKYPFIDRILTILLLALICAFAWRSFKKIVRILITRECEGSSVPLTNYKNLFEIMYSVLAHRLSQNKKNILLSNISVILLISQWNKNLWRSWAKYCRFFLKVKFYVFKNEIELEQEAHSP